MYAAALNGAGTNTGRHRRQPGGGGAAVHAGQHHRPPTTRWTWRSTAPASSRSATAATRSTYTRNGQFKVDRDGYIVNNALQRLMGYAGRRQRRDPARARRCRCSCPPAASTRSATTRARARDEPRLAQGASTLPARRRRRSTSPTPSTYNNATSLTVYDAKGQDVALTYYFQKAGHRPVERLRHRQRHARCGGTRRPRRCRSPPSPSRATAARRSRRTAPVALNVPASTNAAGAQTAADRRRCSST